MKNIIKTILNEQTDNYIVVPAQKYLELLEKYDNVTKFVYKKLTANPEDKGKKIYIAGSLELRDKQEIDNLYGIFHVSGNLYINNTNISDLSDITVSGYISDYGTPYAAIKEKKIRQANLRDSQVRRENNDWDLENPDIPYEGILANAIFEYFINEYDAQIKTVEDTKRLEELYVKIDELIAKEKEYEVDGKDLTDIHADIEAAEEEMNEINQSIDIYNLVPNSNHFELTSFEMISNDEYDGWVFAAGTKNEADKSLESYFENHVDSPQEYFDTNTLSRYIDDDEVEEYAREYYEEVVRDSPSNYFDESDYQLSDEQEEMLDNLKNELSDYEERLEMESDDTPEYELLQNHIESLNSQIEELESEKEITDEMIEEKIDDLVYVVSRDTAGFLREMDISYVKFIDKDKLLDSLVSDSDYGELNFIESSYDEVEILGEKYIVMNYGQ
jgi:hypothetical protein